MGGSGRRRRRFAQPELLLSTERKPYGTSRRFRKGGRAQHVVGELVGGRRARPLRIVGPVRLLAGGVVADVRDLGLPALLVEVDLAREPARAGP